MRAIWLNRLCVCLFAISNCFGGPPSAEVRDVAAYELIPFLQKCLAIGNKDKLGLSASDALDKITLGAPFLLHEITPKAIASYSEGATVDALVTRTTQWYFPLEIDGKPQLFLIVDKLNGKWRKVSVGHRILAAEVARVRLQWPKDKGFTPQFAVMNQTQDFLFWIPELEKDNLSPLVFTPSDNAILKKKASYLAPASCGETVRILRSKLENTSLQRKGASHD